MTRVLTLLLAALVVAAPLRADFSPEKLALIDRPFIGEQMALSPDGRYLAYTENDAERMLLVVADTERHIKRQIPLTQRQRADRAPQRLLVLRWVGPQRLVLQESGGTIAAVDADGGRPVTLWGGQDDGLINDDQLRNFAFIAIPEKPRVIASTPTEPNRILIEGASRLGPERLANLFQVDAVTGESELMNSRLYWGNQVALYGPGDLLVHAPLDPALSIGATPPPPELEIAQVPDLSPRQAMLRALRGETGATRETVARWRFSQLSELTPADGGPVAVDSSSSGRMLYDRNGRPRLLLEQSPKGDRQRYSYTEAGKPPMEPNLVPYSLEEILGQRTRRQETLGKLGEFELRPENFFGERSYPVAFDYDPDVLYLASNVGRDTFGIFSLNLKTRERRDLAPELQAVDLAPGSPEDAGEILVFDDARQKLVGIRYQTLRPHTYWIDPELKELQAALNELMPRHAVEIVSWDNARTRFAVRASSEGDPGGIFLFHRSGNRLEEIAGRAPWLREVALNASTSFGFETPAGVRLSGYLTLPNDSKVDPPPLLIFCHSGLWDRAEPGFNREAEMLADMGLAVMRLNYRGSAGFGRKHLTSIQEGFDTVPVEDVTAAVEWLAGKYGVDRKRVIVMGEGFGGYVALRALQTRPDIFRAAISFNAPTNLDAWAKWQSIPGLRPMKPLSPTYDAFGTYYDFRSIVRTAFVKDGKRRDDNALSAAVAEGDFKKPVLLITNPHSSDLTPLSSLLGGLGLGLGLEGMTVQRMSIGGDFVGGSLETRTQVFRRIDEFLNSNLYQFDAEIGTLREVKGEPVPGRK